MSARQPWALSLALAAVVSDYVGVTMMRVTLPFYAKTLGGSGVLIGGLETAYGIGQWTGALTLPRLSDTWGRRRALVVCVTCSAVGYGLALLALTVSSSTLLLLSRLPVGFAKQTVTVSRAVVADCTEANEDRSRWMSFLGTALAVGCSVGPILGSRAAEYVGEAAPVVGAMAIFIVLGPTVALTLPETSPAGKRVDTVDGAGSVHGAPLWRSRPVVVALLLLALPELGLVAHQGVTLNTFSVHHLGMGKVWVANLNSISAVMQATFACSLCTTLASQGWSDLMLLQLGALSFTMASLVIWLWQTSQAVMWSAPPAALANAVLRSIPPAFLSKQVPEDRQGAAMGLLDVCSSALRVLAPVLAGAFMDAFGGGAVFLGQAALFVSAGVGLLIYSATSGFPSSCLAPGVGADAPRDKIL